MLAIVPVASAAGSASLRSLPRVLMRVRPSRKCASQGAKPAAAIDIFIGEEGETARHYFPAFCLRCSSRRSSCPSSRAAWPRRTNVFGNTPSPQILKEPNSLYQAPSLWDSSGPIISKCDLTRSSATRFAVWREEDR